jgi:hypothetical protein
MTLDIRTKVEGLREFQRVLKYLPDDVKDQVRATNKQLAEVIAREARQRANSRPVKNRTFGVSQSIKTGNVLREPVVRVTGHRTKGSSDARVQEFGGRAPLFGNKQKWFTVRPNSKDGYFLYPAVRAKRDVINKGYLDALEKALRRSGG